MSDSRIGLPEVTLGLLPGIGGVSRTVRLLGLEKALTDVLLQGQRHRPADALAKGLVHEYYEVALQQLLDEGTTLYGVDIGSMYASEIDTLEDQAAADARLALRPAFDTTVDVRLAV